VSISVSKPVHTISVRDLVEFVLRQGDLGGKREFVGSKPDARLSSVVIQDRNLL